MSVLVLGTVAQDTVKTPFGRRAHILGGSAVHFSMSCRFFTDVSLVAVVGEDFPQKYIRFLRGKGVDLTSLAQAAGKTFAWEGEYRGDLNSALTLHTELGVLATFRPQVALRQRKIKHVFLANVDPDIQMGLLKQMSPPAFVGLDSMNYWIHQKRRALLRALKQVHIYVANDQEARDLTGEKNLIKAAKALRSFGPRMVLIKKGEHGVFFYSDAFKAALPAYPVEKVVDPTGAGDTFAGGFMGYLAGAKKIHETSVKKALAFGTVVASFNVEDFGVARTARLTMQEVRARLLGFKRYSSF